MASAESTAALFEGLFSRNRRRVKAALAAGANVNGSPELAYTPLMVTISGDMVSMVNFLIEHRADPEMSAGVDRSCPTVDQGATPSNVSTPSTITVIGLIPGELAICMSRLKQGDVEIVRSLLKRGRADINATDKQGRTPLSTACGCPEDCHAVVRVLVEEGANPALADEDGYTPMHAVAQDGSCTDLADLLCTKAPTTLNILSTEGRTPLFMACFESRERMVSHLLSMGAMQQTFPAHPSMCPLMLATVKGFDGVVRILLNRGVREIGLRSSLGPAIISAVRCFRAKILRMLLAAGGEESRPQWANIENQHRPMLHYAAGDNCPALVNVLLAAGADETRRDSSGCIPRDVIGLDLILQGHQLDREKIVANRRMLEQGPAYRARSWAWPAEEADGVGYGDVGAVVSSAPPAPKILANVQIFRPKDDRKFFMSVVDRYCLKG